MLESHPVGEHELAAKQIGLTYVTDGLPGVSRKRAGKGWAYYDPGGTRITNADERKRINELVIPPAWTDVWICPDPKGHIQATARDAKGRKQYRYHPQYREARDRSKFRRLFELSDVIPAIRGRAESDLRAPELSQRQILATAVQLLDKTLIRVGNEDYAQENKHYGLTTLRQNHVEISGSEMRFAFKGKSGVEHAVALTDRRIAKIIQRCQDLGGQELFQYLNEKGKRVTITSDSVNAYLKEIAGRRVTAKDFRTWGGTMLAGSALREMGPPSTKLEASRNVIRAIDAVAGRLGNTRTVCRKYYVHPALIDAYMEGRTAPEPESPPAESARRTKPRAALRRDEVAILQFLNDLE